MSPRFRRNCLLVGIAGLAACAAGAAANPAAFFRAYLVAYLFWLGIALGCMAIVLIHYLTGGAWGLVIRRVLESGTRTLPLLALAFLPLAFGLRELYEWARPEVVAADALLRHKSAYLNAPFFLVRAAIYLAAWIAVAAVLRRWSPEDAAPPRRLRVLAGPGLAVYGLTMTFAAIDWVMSLEPHWFSTVYGMMFATGQVLAGFAFVIAVTTLLARRAPLAGLVAPNHFTDLGNLLLAFVMLWAYLAFAQYLLIWAGNLPEEIPWYLRRQQGGWAAVAVALIGSSSWPRASSACATSISSGSSCRTSSRTGCRSTGWTWQRPSDSAASGSRPSAGSSIADRSFHSTTHCSARHSDMDTTEHRGHESSDANVRGVVWAGVALAVTALVVQVG
ncbi:MAG: hypothetical protein E6J77_15170, partial [Deltaproteobacteria bacterium]